MMEPIVKEIRECSFNYLHRTPRGGPFPAGFSEEAAQKVERFHQRLPGYRPTDHNENFGELKRGLAIDRDSVLLFFNTEGATTLRATGRLSGTGNTLCPFREKAWGYIPQAFSLRAWEVCGLSWPAQNGGQSQSACPLPRAWPRSGDLWEGPLCCSLPAR